MIAEMVELAAFLLLFVFLVFACLAGATPIPTLSSDSAEPAAQAGIVQSVEDAAQVS